MKYFVSCLLFVVCGTIFALPAFGGEPSSSDSENAIQQERRQLQALQDSLALYSDSLAAYRNPIGGAGRLNFRTSQIKGETAIAFGGQVAIIYKQHWQFGIGAFGQVNSVETEASDVPNLLCDVYMGYLGFEVCRYFKPERKFHWGISSLFGLGSLVIDDASADARDESLLSDSFFILEPSLVGVVNVTNSITADLGLGLRMPVGVVDNQYIKASDLTGLVMSIGLQFSVW